MNHYQMSERATAQLEIDYLRDEIERLREKLKDVYYAKKLLKSKGYFVDNLWCVDDVVQNYNCTNDDAQSILNTALTNNATIEQIFLAIDYAAENLNINKYA